ncbi:unnamed protein product [Rangifer tarandus platyrhynchus]|uniref:Uncharacterized protein n=1 Tax=Rangifer tarandus platyrhynchus TaxID=3082113 RepID=A0AC59Y0B0_RANTA
MAPAVTPLRPPPQLPPAVSASTKPRLPFLGDEGGEGSGVLSSTLCPAAPEGRCEWGDREAGSVQTEPALTTAGHLPDPGFSAGKSSQCVCVCVWAGAVQAGGDPGPCTNKLWRQTTP